VWSDLHSEGASSSRTILTAAGFWRQWARLTKRLAVPGMPTCIFSCLGCPGSNVFFRPWSVTALDCENGLVAEQRPSFLRARRAFARPRRPCARDRIIDRRLREVPFVSNWGYFAGRKAFIASFDPGAWTPPPSVCSRVRRGSAHLERIG